MSGGFLKALLVRTGATAVALVASSLVLAAAPAVSNGSTVHGSSAKAAAVVAVPGVAPNDAPGGTYLDQNGQVLSITGANAGSGGSSVTPDSGCTPGSGRDNPHYTAPDVSGHGWWTKGNCSGSTATVYNCLYEYYTDGYWYRKACSPKKTLKPGGGSAQRTNARVTCNSTGETISWRNQVDVDVNGENDTPEEPYNQANVNCVVN
ncbi:MAG: hypothetical protein ACR2FF_02595 [Mycobacteriales bacterium]